MRAEPLTNFEFSEAFETLYMELDDALSAEYEHLNEVPLQNREDALERYEEHYELIRKARELILQAKLTVEDILW